MRQQDEYTTNTGVAVKTVQHRRPFSRATIPSLIVCLCLTYTVDY